MEIELSKVTQLLSEISSDKITNIIKDKESKEYFGCTFQMGQINYVFRKAKITPKKIGQFVTL